MAKAKKIPQHAYDFSISMSLGVTSLILLYASDSYIAPATTMATAFYFANRGINDLNREHRLKRAAQPFKKAKAKITSFFNVLNTNDVTDSGNAQPLTLK